MTKIARDLGLKAQYQVTRLLKRKELLADIRHRILLDLRERVLDMARNYADPDRLKAAESQIDAVLSEAVDEMMQEEASEASIAKHQPMRSRIARKLCKHLDDRYPSLRQRHV